MSDDRLFEPIKKSLEEDGLFACLQFIDEASLLRCLTREEVALVVLDTGREFSPQNAVLAWRNCHSLNAFPIIVVGRHLAHTCMTAAFDAGADDIVLGDRPTEELLVRVKHVLKRGSSAVKSTTVIKIGPFMLDRSASIVLRDGRAIRLTAREFAIAWLFFSNPGKLLTRVQIAHTIWGKDLSIIGRTLEQHVYKLRCKLHLADSDALLRLSTVYALGYKLDYDRENTEGSQPVDNDGIAPILDGAGNTGWSSVSLIEAAEFDVSDTAILADC
jgi:DNA-binding response OmpR family regulator